MMYPRHQQHGSRNKRTSSTAMLPPTPTSSVYTASTAGSITSSFSGSISSFPNSPFMELDEEHKKQLNHAHALLTQKEYENGKLREALLDWKTKARKWNEAQEKLQEKIRQITAEKEALRKAYSKKCNDDADTITTLAQEIESLKQSASLVKNDKNDAGYNDKNLCIQQHSAAEEASKKAASEMLNGRRGKTTHLIVGINDMVQAIEEELRQLEIFEPDSNENRDNETTNEKIKEEMDADNKNKIGENVNRNTDDALEKQDSEKETTLAPENQKQHQCYANVQHHMNHTPFKESIITEDNGNKNTKAIIPSTSTATIEEKQLLNQQQKESQELSLPTNHGMKNNYQQQKRDFRPRSQTMDTIVKKTSMFFRSNSSNDSNANHSKKTNNNSSHLKKPRPQSTVGLPTRENYSYTNIGIIESSYNYNSSQQQHEKQRPNSAMMSFNSKEQEPKVTATTTKRHHQLFHRLSQHALSSYYQSTPLFKTSSSKSTSTQQHTSGLRQAIAAVDSVRQQEQQKQQLLQQKKQLALSSVNTNQEEQIISSQQQLNTATSTLMHHYRKQQQKMHDVADDSTSSHRSINEDIFYQKQQQQHYQRKRKSAMVSTCSSPLIHSVTGTNKAAATAATGEQWKISNRR